MVGVMLVQESGVFPRRSKDWRTSSIEDYHYPLKKILDAVIASL